jgi:hypothetical protein
MTQVQNINLSIASLAATLRDMADRADRGELVAAAIVAVSADDQIISALSGDRDQARPFTMIGALEDKKFHILREWVEQE